MIKCVNVCTNVFLDPDSLDKRSGLSDRQPGERREPGGRGEQRPQPGGVSVWCAVQLGLWRSVLSTRLITLG